MPSTEFEELESWIKHVLSLGYTPGQVKEYLRRKDIDVSIVDTILKESKKSQAIAGITVKPAESPDRNLSDSKKTDPVADSIKELKPTSSVMTKIDSISGPKKVKLKSIPIYYIEKAIVSIFIVLLIAGVIYSVYIGFIPIKYYDCNGATVKSCRELTDNPDALKLCERLGEKYNNTVSKIIFTRLEIKGTPFENETVFKDSEIAEGYFFVFKNDRSNCWSSHVRQTGNLLFIYNYNEFSIFLANGTSQMMYFLGKNEG